jgi:hypothetical protein
MGMIYQVNPRYTPGSPAQVDRMTAERIAAAEGEAYEDLLMEGRDPAGKDHALRLGLSGIVEQLFEGPAGWWTVYDMITGKRTERAAADQVNRLPAEQRYLRDPMFHLLVDTLRQQIAGGNYTPTELREAVTLACTIHEQHQIRRQSWGLG